MRPCSNSLHWQAADAADEVPCLGNFTVHGKELWSTLSFHFFSGNLDGSFVELALHLCWDHLILYMEPDVIMGTESNITCNARYPINYNVLTIPVTVLCLYPMNGTWLIFKSPFLTARWNLILFLSHLVWRLKDVSQVSWANWLWNKTITTIYPPGN